MILVCLCRRCGIGLCVSSLWIIVYLCRRCGIRMSVSLVRDIRMSVSSLWNGLSVSPSSISFCPVSPSSYHGLCVSSLWYWSVCVVVVIISLSVSSSSILVCLCRRCGIGLCVSSL